MSRPVTAFEAMAATAAHQLPRDKAGLLVTPKDVLKPDSEAILAGATKRLGFSLPQPIKCWEKFVAEVRDGDGPMAPLDPWRPADNAAEGDPVDLIFGGFIYAGGRVGSCVEEDEGCDVSFSVLYDDGDNSEHFYNSSQIRVAMPQRDARLDLLQCKDDVGMDSRVLPELCRLGGDAVVLFNQSAAIIGDKSEEALVDNFSAGRVVLVDKATLSLVVAVLDKATGLPERSQDGAKIRAVVAMEEVFQAIVERDLPVRRSNFSFFNALTDSAGVGGRRAAAVAKGRLARSSSHSLPNPSSSSSSHSLTNLRQGFATPVSTPLKGPKHHAPSSLGKRPSVLTAAQKKASDKEAKATAKKAKEAEAVRKDIEAAMAAGVVGGASHAGLTGAPVKNKGKEDVPDMTAKIFADIKVVKENVMALSQVPQLLLSLARLPAMTTSLSVIPDQIKVLEDNMKDVLAQLATNKSRDVNDSDLRDKDLLGEAVLQVLDHPDWIKAVKAAVREVVAEEFTARGPSSLASLASAPGTPVTPKAKAKPGPVRDRRAQAAPGLDPAGWKEAEKPLLQALKDFMDGPKAYLVAKTAAKYKYEGWKKFSNASALAGNCPNYTEKPLGVEDVENLIPLLSVFSPEMSMQQLVPEMETVLPELSVGYFHLLYLIRRVARAPEEEEKRQAEAKAKAGDLAVVIGFNAKSPCLMAWLTAAVRIQILQKKAPLRWYNSFIRNTAAFTSARTLLAREQAAKEEDKDHSHSYFLRTHLAAYSGKKNVVGLGPWLDAYYLLFGGIDDLMDVNIVELHLTMEHIGLKLQKSPPESEATGDAKTPKPSKKDQKAKKAPKAASSIAASSAASSASSDHDEIDDEY